MKTFEIGQTVYKGKEEGVVVGQEGSLYLVKIGDRVQKLLPLILKTKAPKLKKAKTQPTSNKLSVADFKGFLMDMSAGYQDAMRDVPVFGQVMEAADKAGHFASDVIFKAINRQRISEKQAWAAAYFAKKAGFAA